MNIIKKWYRNARPMSLPQSILPALLAVVMAMNYKEGFSIIMAVLSVVAVGIVHLAMNLSDDYFDYLEHTKQKAETQQEVSGIRKDKYPYLLDGSETKESLRKAIIIMFSMAAVLGGVIFMYRDLDIRLVWVAIAVLVIGVSYSARPLQLGYRGLGELVIGLLFGPLAMIGVYIASCGGFKMDILLISLPVGMLVTNIVYIHSQIDYKTDEKANKMTWARVLGKDSYNLIFSYFLLIMPYVCIIIGIIFFDMQWDYLFVLLTLPTSIWLLGSLNKWYRGEGLQIDKYPKYFGPMPPLEQMREFGIEWVRWPIARNICSLYCGIAMIVNIINRIIC